MSERTAAWKRTAVEGLTIVVSILLALAAEAAWQYRGDRADEREILAGLRVEFEEAESEIRADLRSREGTVAAYRRLRAAHADPAAAPPPDSIDALLRWLRNWRFYTPAHPVLGDLLASGRLELIRSEGVRRALMRYVQERDRIGVFDDLERTFMIERLEPWLSANLDLTRLPADAPAEVRAAEARRFTALLAERPFGSLLQIGLENTIAASEFAGFLLETIQGVRATLE